MAQILTLQQMHFKKKAKLIQNGAKENFTAGFLLLFGKETGVQSFEAWGDEWPMQLAEIMRMNPTVLFSVMQACGFASGALLAESMAGESPEGGSGLIDGA